MGYAIPHPYPYSRGPGRETAQGLQGYPCVSLEGGGVSPSSQTPRSSFPGIGPMCPMGPNGPMGPMGPMGPISFGWLLIDDPFSGVCRFVAEPLNWSGSVRPWAAMVVILARLSLATEDESSNGTWVNDKPVMGVSLSAGCTATLFVN